MSKKILENPVRAQLRKKRISIPQVAMRAETRVSYLYSCLSSGRVTGRVLDAVALSVGWTTKRVLRELTNWKKAQVVQLKGGAL